MLSVVAKLHRRGFLRLVHAPTFLPFIFSTGGDGLCMYPSFLPELGPPPHPPRLIYNSALARPGHTFEMLMLNANLSFIIKNGGNAILKG